MIHRIPLHLCAHLRKRHIREGLREDPSHEVGVPCAHAVSGAQIGDARGSGAGFGVTGAVCIGGVVVFVVDLGLGRGGYRGVSGSGLVKRVELRGCGCRHWYVLGRRGMVCLVSLFSSAFCHCEALTGIFLGSSICQVEDVASESASAILGMYKSRFIFRSTPSLVIATTN